MSREILLLVDALAREKNVEKDIVFAALEQALTSAPPGPFGWSIPVEPFLARAVKLPAFARVRAILAERAS